MSKTRKHTPSFGPKKQKKMNGTIKSHLALKDFQWHDDDWCEDYD